MNRITDTADLTVEQQAKLAYALTVIRSNQSLRGWSQYRMPATGEPTLIRLVKHNRHGRIQQTWDL